MDFNDKSIKDLTDLNEVCRKEFGWFIGPALFRAWEMGFDVAAKLSLDYLDQLRAQSQQEEEKKQQEDGWPNYGKGPEIERSPYLKDVPDLPPPFNKRVRKPNKDKEGAAFSKTFIPEPVDPLSTE